MANSIDVRDEADVRVVTFDKRYLADYVRMNREWIEKYFKIEPMDVAQLERAEETVLAEGGEIFFVIEGGKAVGTCAMVPHGPGCYELAKMAVDPSTRGKGYGSRLIDVVIEWAKEKDATSIMLLSNTILKPAIALYKKHGFQTVHLGPHPDYQRSNIEMVLQLA